MLGSSDLQDVPLVAFESWSVAQTPPGGTVIGAFFSKSEPICLIKRQLTGDCSEIWKFKTSSKDWIGSAATHFSDTRRSSEE